MDWKFFKPSLNKLTVFAILLLIFTFLPTHYVLNAFGYVAAIFKGFPFAGGYCDKGMQNLLPAVLLFLLWYTISCLAVFAYNQVKKK